MHLWLVTILISFSCLAFGQDAPNEDSSTEAPSLDAVTTKSEPVSPVSPPDKETSDIDAALEKSITTNKESSEVEVEIKPLPDVKSVSGLGQLSQFEDVAVIQKRYLPKTSRLEIFPSLGAIINDAFFTNTVASLRLGYSFSESMGLEANAMILGTSERKVTTDLNEKKGVTTRSLVTAQSFYGLDFKWSPVYGKLGAFNTSIVPFDLYFAFGGGITKTNQGENASSLHFGTGQVYALAKWAAFRWDLSWYFYKAQASTGGSGNFTNIYAMVGLSFFVPEAKYR